MVLRKGSLRNLWVALLAVLAGAPIAGANLDPNVERGFDPAKVYQFGEVDHVNLFNGNLTLTIPIGGTYPVGGKLGYGLTLVYNSNVWDLLAIEVSGPPGQGGHSSMEARPNRFANAGLGWMLTLGVLEQPGHWDHPDSWLFVGPDGAEHTFHSKLHFTDDGSPSQSYGYTRDGSYLRLRVVALGHPQDGDRVDVEAADGSVRKFHRPLGADDFRVSELRDPFGNRVTVSYPDAMTWELFDGHRTQVVRFITLLDEKVVDRVELAAFGGSTAVWDFAYDTVTDMAWTCLDTEPVTPERKVVPRLTRVDLPDGSSWRMDSYHRECLPELANVPGMIQKLTLPTGGVVEWTYTHYNFPTRSPGLPTTGGLVNVGEAVGVAGKTWKGLGGGCFQSGEVGCTWAYAPSNNVAGRSRTTTVTYPTGDETVFHLSQDVFFGPQAGTNPPPMRFSSHWHYGLPFRPPELALGVPWPPGLTCRRRSTRDRPAATWCAGCSSTTSATSCRRPAGAPARISGSRSTPGPSPSARSSWTTRRVPGRRITSRRSLRSSTDWATTDSRP